MTNNRVVTRIDSLVETFQVNAELSQNLQVLKEQLADRDQQIAELRERLSQYWELREDVDYQSLIEQIRQDARTVADKLRSLDRHAIRQFAGIGGNADERSASHQSPEGLVSDVLSLLRSINRWK